jgi:hypothetical protein
MPISQKVLLEKAKDYDKMKKLDKAWHREHKSKCRLCGGNHVPRFQLSIKFGKGFLKKDCIVWLGRPDSDNQWLCKVLGIESCNGIKSIVMECIEPGEDFERMFDTVDKSCILIPRRKPEHKCWESFKKTQRRIKGQ